MDNQTALWQTAVCPYQACEGMLVEAEKLSSQATMDSQPGSYVSMMNMSMGQEAWTGGLEPAQAAPPSRTAKGGNLSFAGSMKEHHSVWIGMHYYTKTRTDSHIAKNPMGKILQSPSHMQSYVYIR